MMRLPKGDSPEVKMRLSRCMQDMKRGAEYIAFVQSYYDELIERFDVDVLLYSNEIGNKLSALCFESLSAQSVHGNATDPIDVPVKEVKKRRRRVAYDPCEDLKPVEGLDDVVLAAEDQRV